MTDPVSRETPSPPPLAGKVFSRALPSFERYAAWLGGPGVERGLLGPREVPRLWERHLLNCAAVAEALPPEAAGGAGPTGGARLSTVVDLGSGAGLPGVVLALLRPDLGITLVEPLLRRVTFLTQVVDDLGLDNVEVVRARAEELHGRRRFDTVTARALAPLDRLGRWALPLVAPGGSLVAIKGASAPAELERHRGRLPRWAAEAARVEHLGVGSVDPPVTVIRVQRPRTGG